MRVTTKGRYALRAAIALGELGGEGEPVSIKDISEREGISAEFLEQIFFRLRKAGLIKSVRGPGGGFYFARSLDDISLYDLLVASDEGIELVPCLCENEAACERAGNCRASPIWAGLNSTLKTYAQGTKLSDIIPRSER